MSGGGTAAAIITGAAGGIGQALCEAFRTAGYSVVGTDIAAAAPMADAFVQADLQRFCSDLPYREKIVGSLVSAAGSRPMSVLVNNAALQILGGVEQTDGEMMAASFAINVNAAFLLTKALLTQLETTGGSVVNIASIHARVTKPGFVAYATSKAALVGLTQAMAVDLGGRVRVNALSPAATDTPMLRAGFEDNPDEYSALGALHPLGRIADPREVAEAAVFLASERASFITGACLGVDGGIAARLHDPR